MLSDSTIALATNADAQARAAVWRARFAGDTEALAR